MTPVRVLALTRYDRLGASSRVRMLQYIPYLREQGIDVTPAPLLPDGYVSDLYAGRPRNLPAIVGAYLRRLTRLLRTDGFQTLWIEKELLPWIPYAVERLVRGDRIKCVVDMDDAVWLRYTTHESAVIRRLLGRKIGRVLHEADVVAAGSGLLADFARSQGARCVVDLPSVVDLDRYPVSRAGGDEPVRIGWVGSPATEHYLDLVADGLRSMSRAHAFTLVTVGASRFQGNGIAIRKLSWSHETEARDVGGMDIGIMPLPDEPWEQGKCGYKLIQYMACGLPVVASPVGANRDIVEHGRDGYLAAGTEEWVACLERLIDDPSLRERMGRAGREKVERAYSLQNRLSQVAAILRP